jgi:hypothetical protein
MGENLKPKYLVYLTTNTVNNKIYIGVHKTLTDKFDGYLGCGVLTYKASSYKFSQTPFQYAVNKYGPDKFIRVTLKEFDNLQDALDLEAWLVTTEFIKRRDTYNITEGGNVPPHTLREVSQYTLDGEYIQTFESISLATHTLKGTKSLNIARAIKTKGQAGNYMWSYDKVDKLDVYDKINKPRKVAQYTLDGKLVKIYDTVRECKKDFCGCVHVLKGTRNQAGGYTFKYVE